jgi:hypothetical protein
MVRENIIHALPLIGNIASIEKRSLSILKEKAGYCNKNLIAG